VLRPEAYPGLALRLLVVGGRGECVGGSPLKSAVDACDRHAESHSVSSVGLAGPISSLGARCDAVTWSRWAAVTRPRSLRQRSRGRLLLLRRTVRVWLECFFVPRFAAFDASGLRRASAIRKLPWLASSIALIHVNAAGVVSQAATPPQKRRLLDDAIARDLVLDAWRGQWGQEVLVVDDLRQARAAVKE
jgi:hypothetical protein